MSARKLFASLAACAAVVGTGAYVGSVSGAGPDKNTVKVPGGLGFAEFKGYETWETVAVSYNGKTIAVILGNPAMIAAYKAGIPANGKPVPDGARMAKIHYVPKKNQYFPDMAVPDVQHDVDFMVKDSKRFADSGGWGWAVFKYDAAAGTFSPGTMEDMPPQAHDAKCGFTCHTKVKARDYVFTDYAPR